MKYLNLGCGKKYVQDATWINADMVPLGKDVQQCNFLNGIPFENEKFKLVYHSHVLEHFSKDDGLVFLKECYRIIENKGVLRIALPNLEKIVRLYIQQIDNWNTDPLAKEKYSWTMLELYDQTVRNTSGGEMHKYLSKLPENNKAFVLERIGKNALSYFNAEGKTPKRNWGQKLQKLRQQPSLLFEKIANTYFRIVLWGKHYDYYKTGAFRKGGEIHQWMYDQYALGDILKEIGFIEIKVQSASTSYIDNWAAFKLDDPNEEASLFIEAIK